jgi:hypothetical protein
VQVAEIQAFSWDLEFGNDAAKSEKKGPYFIYTSSDFNNMWHENIRRSFIRPDYTNGFYKVEANAQQPVQHVVGSVKEVLACITATSWDPVTIFKSPTDLNWKTICRLFTTKKNKKMLTEFYGNVIPVLTDKMRIEAIAKLRGAFVPDSAIIKFLCYTTKEYNTLISSLCGQ